MSQELRAENIRCKFRDADGFKATYCTSSKINNNTLGSCLAFSLFVCLFVYPRHNAHIHTDILNISYW